MNDVVDKQMTRKEIDKAFKKARFCTGKGYEKEHN